MCNKETRRLLIIDSQSLTCIALRAIISSDPALHDITDIRTASTLEDALAAGREQAPDIILLDTAVPASYTARMPASLFRAVSALSQIRRSGSGGILLMHPADHTLIPALILLYKKRISAILGKNEVASLARLRDAIYAALAGDTYISICQQRQLSDLMAGQEFHILSPASMQLIEALHGSGTPQGAAEILGIHRKSIYRRLEQLAQDLGVEHWRGIPAHIQELGLIDQGQLICNCVVRRHQRVYQGRQAATAAYAAWQ